MYQYIKTQSVEIPVTVTSSTLLKYYFPTQNFLRTKQIASFEIFTINDMALSPFGNALITSANLKNGYLTLYGADPEPAGNGAMGEWITTFPLASLHRLVNGTDPYVFELPKLIPRVIVWEKSYVTMQAVLGNSGGPVSFLFNVGYMGVGGDD